MDMDLYIALQMMWKGMVGIFAVVIVIALIVFIMQKIDNAVKSDNQKSKEE